MTLEPPTLADVRSASERITGQALRTPLLRLEVADAPAEIHLKLENLQPIGSFKLRGAGNAIARLPSEALEQGIVTASAGNMAQGVAWQARKHGVPCTVVVPDTAPRTKLAAIERLGGRILAVPFDRWWQVLEDRAHPDAPGTFVHPVSDADVIAGNGTIGLEIFEDLPDVDTVVVPYGGGGLSSGIASALRELSPGVRVLACEVDQSAPLSAALAAGEPRSVEHVPSFVDGIGAKRVLPEMWPLASSLLAGAVTVSVAQVADAVRLLVERQRVVAEGAGAASVAAALAGHAGTGKVACVISGGNIDAKTLATILRGDVPG